MRTRQSRRYDRDSLRCDYYLLQETCLSEYIVVIGMGMATLSTSLGALFGGARVLQAIARDKIFPFTSWFAYGSKHGDEPHPAVLYVTNAMQMNTSFHEDMGSFASPLCAYMRHFMIRQQLNLAHGQSLWLYRRECSEWHRGNSYRLLPDSLSLCKR